MMKKLLLLLSAACALTVSIAACDKLPGKQQQASFQNTDVTGLDYAKGFSLTDHTGKPRTLADFKGKAVVVFFGYTQCPDVCPTTMAEMATVMQKLGPLADQVQVLFITLDPERDTQQLLASYVPAFDKRFIGLRGTPELRIPRVAIDGLLRKETRFVEALIRALATEAQPVSPPDEGHEHGGAEHERNPARTRRRQRGHAFRRRS